MSSLWKIFFFSHLTPIGRTTTQHTIYTPLTTIYTLLTQALHSRIHRYWALSSNSMYCVEEKKTHRAKTQKSWNEKRSATKPFAKITHKLDLFVEGGAHFYAIFRFRIDFARRFQLQSDFVILLFVVRFSRSIAVNHFPRVNLLLVWFWFW